MASKIIDVTWGFFSVMEADINCLKVKEQITAFGYTSIIGQTFDRLAKSFYVA